MDVLTNGPDFQGLYLASGDSDFYIHLALSAAATGLGDPLLAFMTERGKPVAIHNLGFEVTEVQPALGFFPWPAAWAVAWQADCGQALMTVESIDHHTESNWVVGGFAMRPVLGAYRCGAETREFYGFSELIR
jgi:hypothetical protein